MCSTFKETIKIYILWIWNISSLKLALNFKMFAYCCFSFLSNLTIAGMKLFCCLFSAMAGEKLWKVIQRGLFFQVKVLLLEPIAQSVEHFRHPTFLTYKLTCMERKSLASFHSLAKKSFQIFKEWILFHKWIAQVLLLYTYYFLKAFFCF